MIIVVVFIILEIITASVFWRTQFIFSAILIVLAIFKHFLIPIKQELLWFLIVGVLGTAGESLIMWLGGNPWVYTLPLVFNVPVWLILFWGLTGTVFISLREELLKSKNL